MAEIVGIDLGTTNSLIGIMEAGFPILVADAEGNRLTPSVVHVGKNGETLIGNTAARMRVLDPKRTVYSIKRYIGSGNEAAADDMAYEIQNRNGRWVVNLDERKITPEEISSLILKKLKADAENALGRTLSRAVITVPAYFNDAQRSATKLAGELAGFAVERIVNEPTAAALAYGMDKLGDKSRIAVYDLGGGTFDISILELNQGVFQVIATNGNVRLGGDDVDRALVDYLITKWELQDVDGSLLSRIREAAVEAKHRLSTEEDFEIQIPFAAEGKNFVHRLSRAELDAISKPIIEKTRFHCARALADAKIKADALDEIILVGGMTRMPLVRRFVKEFFGKEPNITQNPDEVVAVGATLQAGILSGAVQNVLLLDVTPLSLGIETFGGLMNVIIPRNSTIPLKRGEMFTNAVANQQTMAIKVLQGEREMARDNWMLGEFELEFQPAPKGQARVGVQFEIDANGILHVLARDTKTGHEKTVEIKSAVDVSDEAVEKMIAESLDHAFEDVNERRLTEAKLKSSELIPAVKKALLKVGGAIPSEIRERIEVLLQETEAAAEGDDYQRLRKANAALDEGTEHLAALLIEAAMGGKR